MNKFAAKVMGVALTVPMVLGGAIAYADETVVSCSAADDTQNASYEYAVPGDQVYQEDIYVSGNFKGGQLYQTGTQSFYAPVSGTYYFVTSDEDDNYLYAVRSVEPIFTIEGVTSNNPGDYWGCNSVVHLEEGEHQIAWQGRLPGWFTLTGTILSVDAPVTAVGDPVCLTAAIPAADYSAIPMDLRIESIKNFVGHMYLECLGREASQAEINFWADKLMNGDITATSVAAQMLTSEEFGNRNISDEEFVAILTSVFGDGISEQTALAALTSGKTRSGVINQFAGSEQWASKCAFYMVNV